jgi:predicted DNA-binding transcriptional regulator AlpA
MSEGRIDQQAFGWTEQAVEPRAEERAVPEPTPRARGRPRRAGWGAAGAAGAPHAAPPRSAEPLPPDGELWDVHAAARFLKRSVSWVYHRVEDGTLPVRRLAGWGVRFIPAELRAWVGEGSEPRRRRAKPDKE